VGVAGAARVHEAQRTRPQHPDGAVATQIWWCRSTRESSSSSPFEK